MTQTTWKCTCSQPPVHDDPAMCERNRQSTRDYLARTDNIGGPKFDTLATGAKRGENMIVVDWTSGDGTGHEGYNVADYFDADGSYLGPDEHGIEPIFAIR